MKNVKRYKIKLADLDIRTSTINYLAADGITTVGDVIENIAMIVEGYVPGIGRKSLSNLREALGTIDMKIVVTVVTRPR